MEVETWAMEAALCQKGQAVTNEAMRLVLGCKTKATTIPVAAMWRESGVPEAKALFVARKARAWFKLPSSSSLLSRPGWGAVRVLRRRRGSVHGCHLPDNG